MRVRSRILCPLIAAILLLPAAAAAQPYECWDGDDITVAVAGGDVLIQHLADLINCCPDPITYDLDFAEGVLSVTENWVLGCHCDCCFDIAVTVSDVPPGTWTLSYAWLDIESGDWVVRTLPLEIPDLGQGSAPAVASTADSGCLEPVAASSADWSALKAAYR